LAGNEALGHSGVVQHGGFENEFAATAVLVLASKRQVFLTMAAHPIPPRERRKSDPQTERRLRAGVSKPVPGGRFRSLGLGLITGASDDDPAAIGTYAVVGASLGPSFLWTVPAILPMTYATVYLCSKVGQVAGEGLFAVIRKHYPRWILFSLLVCALIGNVIEAAADMGGMSAALNLLVPIPERLLVLVIGVATAMLQIMGSYKTIKNVFRWLALVLLAYVGAAFLAKPDFAAVLKGTFIPTMHFDTHSLSMLVAIIGTTLSAYLYSWQSNEEVEEEISRGRRRLVDRMGSTRDELRHARLDVGAGMIFASVVTYFIMLSTAATLFKAGKHDINTAAEAAQALAPIAGKLSETLFALGVFSVGLLAVPVMITGAAYDVCQTFGWKHGLHYRPGEVKKFSTSIAVFTVLAVGLNFLGINPMKALVFSSIVQGISTPFLMLLIMLITTNQKIMGRWINTRPLNILGWLTTGAMFAASVALLITAVR
jgi:NRAMP (natural resistance-associated macrophage protein)-like metal ion transporter